MDWIPDVGEKYQVGRNTYICTRRTRDDTGAIWIYSHGHKASVHEVSPVSGVVRSDMPYAETPKFCKFRMGAQVRGVPGRASEDWHGEVICLQMLCADQTPYYLVYWPEKAAHKEPTIARCPVIGMREDQLRQDNRLTGNL